MYVHTKWFVHKNGPRYCAIWAASGREEPPRPVIGTARVPAECSIFDRVYKVFRLGEPHVPSCANDAVFIRFWGRGFVRFRQNDMEMMEMRQVL